MRKIYIGLFLISLLSTPIYAFKISSGFGWRYHPLTKKWQFHTGIDIPLSYGTPILAIFDGKVTFAGGRGGYGIAVVIRHADGTQILYGHCTKLLVQKGDLVKARDMIALAGSTGVSTGPHLHLEYWVNHRYVDPLVIWNKGR